ncbi:60S ribosomal protein L9 [Pseudoloma neurophilia]|uniref:60S ribosomal protein L9 n=1 Tax=Pseudoloma neurophilia TaxID=146866 RepID=A0A0R0LYN5_9MICR|nr:60S ribosomal protein L9 [Pseudoloma neurophilia]
MVEFYTERCVPIPKDCEVTINDRIVTIKYKERTITRDFRYLFATFDVFEGKIRLRLWNARRQERAKLITCSSHIKNMILGVTKGFEYVLKAAYVHFPIAFDIQEDGKVLIVKNFLGEKSARVFKMRGESIVKVGNEKDTVVISGTSIEDVSQSAGNVQSNCVPRNFDVRKFMDGVYISDKYVVGE